MRPSTLRPASREVTTESPASIVTLSSARHGPRSSFLNTYVARRSTSYGSLVVDVQIQPTPEALDHGHRARPPVADSVATGAMPLEAEQDTVAADA
jgi:hypothetical protein